MKTKKQFIVGFLLGAVLFGSATAFAESSAKIDVIFGRVKLVVNNKPADKETLLYNGTTYVPLRAAAEILGKEVAWDGSANTAYIDEPGTGRTFGAAATTKPAPIAEPWESFYKTDDYNKYTTPASENGLDGTLLKIVGEVTEIVDTTGSADIEAFIVKDGQGNKWLIAVTSDSALAKKAGDKLTIYGAYQGISAKFNDLPTIYLIRYKDDQGAHVVKSGGLPLYLAFENS